MRARRCCRRTASSSTGVTRAATGATVCSGSGSAASSGGRTRTSLIADRIEPRRDGGGVAVASRDSSAAVSQNSTTSWLQVGQTARWASNSSSSEGSSAFST